MYIICHKDIGENGKGARLCQDGMFRNFANFGTFSWNVKVYRKEGWALRRQTILDNRGCPVYIVRVPTGLFMDASGEIFLS